MRLVLHDKPGQVFFKYTRVFIYTAYIYLHWMSYHNILFSPDAKFSGSLMLRYIGLHRCVTSYYDLCCVECFPFLLPVLYQHFIILVLIKPRTIFFYIASLASLVFSSSPKPLRLHLYLRIPLSIYTTRTPTGID